MRMAMTFPPSVWLPNSDITAVWTVPCQGK
jgi:hypothetical protein